MAVDSQEIDISEHYREMISILFAIVFAQTLPNYRPLFTTLHSPSSAEVLPLFALITAHVSIIGSWLGYHHMLYQYPYKEDDMFSKIRLMADILIVTLYFFLITLAQELRTPAIWSCTQGCIHRFDLWLDFSVYLIGDLNLTLLAYIFFYIPIYLLYIVNDFSVQWGYDDPGAGFITLNLKVGFIIAALSLSYTFLNIIEVEPLIPDFSFPLAVLATVLFYRYKIWRSTKPESI